MTLLDTVPEPDSAELLCIPVNQQALNVSHVKEMLGDLESFAARGLRCGRHVDDLRLVRVAPSLGDRLLHLHSASSQGTCSACCCAQGREQQLLIRIGSS